MASDAQAPILQEDASADERAAVSDGKEPMTKVVAQGLMVESGDATSTTGHNCEPQGETRRKRKRKCGWDTGPAGVIERVQATISPPPQVNLSGILGTPPVGLLGAAAKPIASTVTSLASAIGQSIASTPVPDPSAILGRPPSTATSVPAIAVSTTTSDPIAALAKAKALAMLHQPVPAAKSIANRIYIGSLYYEVKQNDVKQLFSPFGQVTAIDMSYEPLTGKSKGYAFVEYSDPLAAESAIRCMSGAIVGGRAIKVGRPHGVTLPAAGGLTTQSEPGTYSTIYIGNVLPAITEDQIKTVFSAFGPTLWCKMVPDPANPAQHHGYGFIEFREKEHASEVVKHMDGFDLAGQAICVGRASPAATALRLGSVDPLAAAMQAAQKLANQAIGAPHRVETGASLALEEDVKISSKSRIELSKKLSREVEALTSRCVVLMNMIDPEEVDDALEDEVREECETFGTIDSVKIQDFSKTSGVSAVKIYVRFQGLDSAVKAKKSLDGRFFAGRSIRAAFYDDAKFLQGSLS